MTTNRYADILLPLSLEKLLTYALPEEVAAQASIGMRVAVAVRGKIYTGLIRRLHNEQPAAYTPKEIIEILDTSPLVGEHALRLWDWIASYYCCTAGEVFRAALPTALKLESETKISLDPAFIPEQNTLSDDEFLIWEALASQSSLTVETAGAILDKKRVMPILKQMLEKGILCIFEEYRERYKPQLTPFVRLAGTIADTEGNLAPLFENTKLSPKQSALLLAYLSLSGAEKTPVAKKQLLEYAGASEAVLKGLCGKDILEIFQKQTDRLTSDEASLAPKELSDAQKTALEEIREGFAQKKPGLLHGVTGSGKTEIYVRLIEDALAKGRQVLYLVPEIALTTQLIERLKRYFGKKVGVYHSRYNENERTESFSRVARMDDSRYDIIVGARSAVFLPFQNLSLVIVDEEHEASYKQQEPTPRYHARDVAAVLASIWEADILLGSATPSIESYYNAERGKYSLVKLDQRWGDAALPQIRLINLQDAYRDKGMRGHFSLPLVKEMNQTLEANEQIILFQNRRGFAPMLECRDCGYTPECPHCDVSLTYHKHSDSLRCHYCGYSTAKVHTCPVCGGKRIETKGFGTEQIEAEVHELFPEARVERMDLDTTSKKDAYFNIIRRFEQREVDILVGTQMLSKGLDFDNVTLVGILNADNMLRIPDMRAQERAFQMLSQVSGRSGRRKSGRVVVQSYDPQHKIIRQVAANDYTGMYADALPERQKLLYPPFARMIKLEFRHKDLALLNGAVEQICVSLRSVFGQGLLGPDFAPIERINSQYIKQAFIKLPREASPSAAKTFIMQLRANFLAVKAYASVRFTVDVDPY